MKKNYKYVTPLEAFRLGYEYETTCAFCKRKGLTNIHFHHVIPRCKGGKEVAPTCSDCEGFIHNTWSHNELRDTYNTVEIIKKDEKYQKFLKWLLKQKPEKSFKTIRNNNRPKGKYT